MKKGIPKGWEAWLCQESNEMHVCVVAYRSIPLDMKEKAKGVEK